MLQALQPAPVREVRGILQGPVANIFSLTLLELRSARPAAVYDRIMNSPRLLDRALRHFREHRELFSHLTKDRQGAAATDDDAPLRCGRTVSEVIRLVLRACAKRYFRRYFLAKTYAGPLGRLRLHLYVWFGLGEARRRAAQQQAVRHLQALDAHLRHDWQAKLIPVYAALPTAALSRLGSDLLVHRDSAALLRAVHVSSAAKIAPRTAEPQNPAPRPRLVAGRSRYLADDARRVAEVAASGGFGRWLGALDAQARRSLAQQVEAVPEPVLAALDREGLSPAEATVLLVAAAQALGAAGFAALFLGDRGPRRAQELSRRLGGAERRRLANLAGTVAPLAA